jgi:hypothetical protein
MEPVTSISPAVFYRLAGRYFTAGCEQFSFNFTVKNDGYSEHQDPAILLQRKRTALHRGNIE